jgi:hypothetical protein
METAAHDLRKKNDDQFGSTIEPLMPIDYPIGVGTFAPNNAVIIHEDAVKLMTKVTQEKGIKHTTSQCTLRGFTCSSANVDPRLPRRPKSHEPEGSKPEIRWMASPAVLP